jgi:hypothetical protein
MHDVVSILSPVEILDCYESAWSRYDHGGEDGMPTGDLRSAAIASAMWAKLGGRTTDVMVEGARALAMVWDSAWAAGGGPDLSADAIPQQAINADTMRELYIDPGFAPSKQLDQIRPYLR